MTDAMNLNRLAYFAAVVDTGSFTRAAERLGITKAVVSQQVAQLEQDLGTSLLVRTTRRVHPTEAGRMFHARCVMILREAEDAFDELAQAAAEPTGTLADHRAQRLRHRGGRSGRRRLYARAIPPAGWS